MASCDIFYGQHLTEHKINLKANFLFAQERQLQHYRQTPKQLVLLSPVAVSPLRSGVMLIGSSGICAYWKITLSIRCSSVCTNVEMSFMVISS